MAYWYSGTYGLTLEIEREDAEYCSQGGRDAEPYIEETLRAKPELRKQIDAWDADKLRKELADYGAWDDAELADDEQNRIRMFWIACADVRENPGDYE